MQVNSKIKFYWEKLPLKSCVYASFGVSLFLALVILLFQKALPPQVPLFYGEPVGEGQLVGSAYLLVAPLFAFAITLLNSFIASKIDDDFTKKFLIVSAFFVSILIFITLTKVFFLVGTF